jgi:hypothetical protein
VPLVGSMTMASPCESSGSPCPPNPSPRRSCTVRSDALKDKTETKAQYEAYVRETESLRKELGIMTADELYERPYDSPDTCRALELIVVAELRGGFRPLDLDRVRRGRGARSPVKSSVYPCRARA